MHSSTLGETLLSKRLALPVFCSDPLSSVAYATEQILLVLVLWSLSVGIHAVGGTGCDLPTLLWLSGPTAKPSTRTRTVVVPTPSAGTTSARSHPLIAASALMVDYVLTVAVSVTAGVANIASAIPVVGSTWYSSAVR